MPVNALQARIDELVQRGLAAADDPAHPVSALARLALRVARLREDWDAVWWLSIETRSLGEGSDAFKTDLADEVRAHFTGLDIKAVNKRHGDLYLAERAVSHFDEHNRPTAATCSMSLDEIEHQIVAIRAASEPNLPPGLAPVDVYKLRQSQEEARLIGLRSIRELGTVLGRVRNRIAVYLARTEKEILFGQYASDAFERNRGFVDGKLGAVAPDALESMSAAYRRRADGDAEGRSHALTSCRRALAATADALCPATGEVVFGLDGKSHTLTRDKFVNRLLHFAESNARHRASKELLIQQIEHLAGRLAALNGLASKGVHAQVTEAEVDQCVIQTYLVIGDLLRIEAGDSAALQVEAAEAS